MIKCTKHYSNNLDAAKLSDRITRLSDTLVIRMNRLLPTGASPVLVFTGYSGTSLASALSVELYRKGWLVDMLYVRKPEEVSHGQEVHCSTTDLRDKYFIFVDDFIDSGTTALRMDTAVKAYGGITLHCLNAGVYPPTTDDDYGLVSKLSDSDYAYYSTLLPLPSDNTDEQ